MSDDNTELEGQEPEKFERSPLLTQDGWLTPGGIFYKSDPTTHGELAAYLAEKLGFDEDEIVKKSKTPRQILYEEGYVLMSQGTPFVPEKNLTRSQIEIFNQSNVLIPTKGTRMEDNKVKHFAEAYVGEFTTSEKNIITALISSRDRTVNIWDNQELTSKVLEKITREMEPGERIELTEYYGGLRGSYFQYWLDKEKGIAITHFHHRHAGDSAHYYDAPAVDERISVRTPEEALEDFEREKSFWEGRSMTTKARLDSND